MAITLPLARWLAFMEHEIPTHIDPYQPWLRVKRRSWRTLWVARTYRVPREVVWMKLSTTGTTEED